MKKIYLIITLSAAAFVSCDSVEKVNYGPIHEIPLADNIELAVGEASVNDGMNAFAFDFLNAVADAETDAGKNITVSPLSASLALAILANTADDVATEKVAGLLGFDDLATLNTTANKLMRYLPSKKAGARLELANSVWYNNKYAVRQDYVDNLARTFYSEVNGADFDDFTTLSLVNGWCNDKTHGMIPSIMDEISRDRYFMLINALYFSGEWKSPFDKTQTSDAVFHGVGKTGTVRMMHSASKAAYHESDIAEAASLEFKGDTRFMAVLPKAGNTAEDMAKTFSLADYRSLMYDANVSLKLDIPRFMTSGKYENMMDVMVKMGLPSSVYAERMGIECDVLLKSIQKCALEIDEDGARLSASTSVSGNPTSPAPAPEVRTLTFNRPFLFVVENTTTGTILMAGVVNTL